MRLLSRETGYRDTEGLSYLTDYTDVHGLNSVKICDICEKLCIANRNSIGVPMYRAYRSPINVSMLVTINQKLKTINWLSSQP